MAKRRFRIAFQKPDPNAPRDEHGHAGPKWLHAGFAMATAEQVRQTETDSNPQTTAEATYLFETWKDCDRPVTQDMQLIYDGRAFNITRVEEFLRRGCWHLRITGIEDTSARVAT